jgi:hypothetical protein
VSTIRDRLVNEAILELNTSRPSDVPEFERVNGRPRDKTQLPAHLVYPSREGITPIHNRNGPLVQRQLRLRIEMRAQGGDTDVDKSLAWVTKTLAGSRLNKLCHEILEDNLDWTYRRRGKPYCLCVLELIINYSTNRLDQELIS